MVTHCRGVVGMEVEVVTAGTDMHSGFKGGSVANPCIVMSTLLATLHDKTTGRIDVDEFYEVRENLHGCRHERNEVHKSI